MNFSPREMKTQLEIHVLLLIDDEVKRPTGNFYIMWLNES